MMCAGRIKLDKGGTLGGRIIESRDNDFGRRKLTAGAERSSHSPPWRTTARFVFANLLALLLEKTGKLGGSSRTLQARPTLVNHRDSPLLELEILSGAGRFRRNPRCCTMEKAWPIGRGMMAGLAMKVCWVKRIRGGEILFESFLGISAGPSLADEFDLMPRGHDTFLHGNEALGLLRRSHFGRSSFALVVGRDG